MKSTNQLIRKIEIQSFRSIEKLSIDKIGIINVFSGINDVGKSNILKALNLFFNGYTDFFKPLKFDVDYNKISRAKMRRSAKMKQLIKVRIYLNPPSTYETLASEKNIFIEKQFDRFGNVTEKYSTNDSKKKTSITKLFHRIKYIYVPALKGEKVLQYLLSLIGERELISKKGIQSLNKEIKEKTSDLTEILKSSGVEIGTTFGLPTLLSDFWQRLSVNTEYEQFDKLDKEIKGKNANSQLDKELFNIPLLLRGEGIKSKYIPPLLQWLNQNDKNKIFVWGIDEPENSLEFRLADQLARLFYNKYAVRNQIFITSHSLAFINPPNDVKFKPKRYEIYKDDLGGTKCKDFEALLNLKNNGNHTNKAKLFIDLGVIEAQKDFMEHYREVISQNENLQATLDNVTEPLLIVEGKTDKIIISTAWKKLYGEKKIEMPFDIYSSEINPEKGGGGAEAVRRALEYISMLPNKRIIIGIFDNDREGNNQFKGLNKSIFEEHKEQVICRKHIQKNIYALLLPCPQNRRSFVGEKFNQRYLTIEHYFTDEILEQYNLIGDKIASDSNIFHIKNGSKVGFANNITKFDKNSFQEFSILFEKILSILENKVKCNEIHV